MIAPVCGTSAQSIIASWMTLASRITNNSTATVIVVPFLIATLLE